jgi:serine/threonine protein kinase
MAAAEKPKLDLGCLHVKATTGQYAAVLSEGKPCWRQSIEMEARKDRKILGKGKSGIVLQIVDSSGKVPVLYAVKMTPATDEFSCNEFEMANLLRSKEDKVGIFNNVDCWFTQNYLYLVMEIADTSLLTCIEIGEIPRDARWLILGQILHGLDFLHKSGFVHGDLKPANILLSKLYGAQISDFATANKNPEKQVGTKRYMPPEQILDGRPATREGDIWCIGMTTVEMVIGGHAKGPDGTSTTVEDLERDYRKQYNPLTCLDGRNDDYVWTEVAKCCLHLDPQQRASVGFLVQEYFQKIPQSTQDAICQLIEKTQCPANGSSM